MQGSSPEAGRKPTRPATVQCVGEVYWPSSMLLSRPAGTVSAPSGSRVRTNAAYDKSITPFELRSNSADPRQNQRLRGGRREPGISFGTVQLSPSDNFLSR